MIKEEKEQRVLDALISLHGSKWAKQKDLTRSIYTLDWEEHSIYKTRINGIFATIIIRVKENDAVIQVGEYEFLAPFAKISKIFHGYQQHISDISNKNRTTQVPFKEQIEKKNEENLQKAYEGICNIKPL